MTEFQWLIGGEAGYGIMTVGYVMSKTLARFGLSVFDYAEYPSLIRGGHNIYYVRASDEEIFSQKKSVDILVALNQETIVKQENKLSAEPVIIYDPDTVKIDKNNFPAKTSLTAIPLSKLAEQVGADKLMINTVSLGASLAILDLDFKALENVLKDFFVKKGDKVTGINILCAKAGFDFVRNNYKDQYKFKLFPKEDSNLLISGAEVISIGAIKAGLKFAAIYPMTPINGILLNLAEHALEYKIIVKEPEDEIAAINMALGASFAGVRSMTATSGGGFSLMVEGLGLAAQSEMPIVIIEGMRPGPSTGLPTWTDQGDLQFILHAGQGDFPRIVIAPGDMEEVFNYITQAFNLAEKYQLPVIVLVDKYLMESHSTVQSSKFKVQSERYTVERGKRLIDEEAAQLIDYKRYQVTGDGISQMSLPGQEKGISLADSYEHDERGLYNEDSGNRIKMMEKRFNKLKTALGDLPISKFYGSKEGDLTLISFGSTKMPIMEAMKTFKKENLEVNFLHLSFLNPFPAREVETAIRNAKKTLIIEGNYSGQLESLIKEKTGLSIEHNFRKYDGRPFYPEEIMNKVRDVLK